MEVCSDKIMVLLLLLWMLHHVHTTLSPRPSKLRQVSPGSLSLSIPSNAVCTTASFGIHYTRGPQEMPILNDFDNQPVICAVMER